MRIDFEITYRGETVNLDLTASQMVVSFTLYDGNFPNGGSITQVQSDWNQTNNTQVDFIKNKPTIPSIAGLATETFVTNITDEKVDKVTGKGLSENDLTDLLKATYDGYASLISAKANKSEVPIVLFASTTKTIITGKTAETSIYSIPLPIDGFNYVIKLYSQAQTNTFAGSAISHRIRVGEYATVIDGAGGADSIGQQTLLAMVSNGSTQSYPIIRNLSLYGGSSGTIFGFPTNSTINDEVLGLPFITLATKDFNTQHYLYVSFNPSNIGAIVQHSKIYITAIRV
jgi:hypothetical protein